MTSEECPRVLAVAHVGAGLCEDYSPAQGEEAIEEAGPADDVSSELSALVVPFPELAPIVFFCLKQTTCPRNLCIRMVSSPYPLPLRTAAPCAFPHRWSLSAHSSDYSRSAPLIHSLLWLLPMHPGTTTLPGAGCPRAHSPTRPTVLRVPG
ncbi:hypothetical protein AAFF_G00295660 [Aldrovandia affinis]|uniref:Uncharacterized protein n=1 Tax=Aldrovandia affinis TaxID=143900 RepID=A0AAD7WRS7_9TELE|nr:hypothetical protein AAFF_G00295660 [Aldrovandia affinis]